MAKTLELSQTRILGIAAHVDAGKTTLTERILFYTGRSHHMGEVHDGTAHMDYLAEEQQHGITITAAVTQAPWQGHTLQILDTPGHVDFTVEVERSMRVLDSCIIVLDGVRGVEPQTETVWRQRQKFALPCLLFINKMDRPGADFGRALESVRQRLHAEPVPLTVPLPERRAVVHLIEGTLWEFTGAEGEVVQVQPCESELWAALTPYRESLWLAAAEMNEQLADMVLAGETPEPERLWRALRIATLQGRIQPCCSGAALRNFGVQPLLDAVVRLLPSPLERPPSSAHLADGSIVPVAMDACGPFAGLAFKVQMWDGRRHVFVRIYRGRLKPGDSVVTPRAAGGQEREQVTRLFEVDAGKKKPIDHAEAGQIVLLAGLRRVTTGDTLCHPEHPLSLERIEVRAPVLSLAVEPLSSADEDKLLECLDKLLQEDPTLRVQENADTGQRLLFGMGELHLQIAFERLEREYGLRLRTGQPRVAVRETLIGSAVENYTYHRAPDLAQKLPERRVRVRIAVSPRPRGTGIALSMTPHILPPHAILTIEQKIALEQGVGYVLGSGPVESAPLEDMSVTIEEVELFGNLSPPESLLAAASHATRRACEMAGGQLLRPIMFTEIVIPTDYLGSVLGDLQSRQALIRHTARDHENSTIHCEVGLDRLLGYATALRGFTQGRGQFTMEFLRFDRL